MGSSAVPKTVWNVGRATLTTVMSRIDMIAARSTTPEILRTAASILSGYCGVSRVDIQMTPRARQQGHILLRVPGPVDREPGCHPGGGSQRPAIRSGIEKCPGAASPSLLQEGRQQA